ncbi:hypothetical protein [Neobacillus sp. LXY-1]
MYIPSMNDYLDIILAKPRNVIHPLNERQNMSGPAKECRSSP